MKRGDKVRVYQHPVTDEQYEGEAVLVRFCDDCSDPGEEKGEYWLVRFRPDEDVVHRWVHARNLVK